MISWSSGFSQAVYDCVEDHKVSNWLELGWVKRLLLEVWAKQGAAIPIRDISGHVSGAIVQYFRKEIPYG